MAKLLPVFSSLFRIIAYIYLRVIPVHRYGKFALPALYSAFLLFALPTLSGPSPTLVVVPERVEVVDIKDEKTGELIEEIIQVEGKAVVVEPANGSADASAAPVAARRGVIDTLGSLICGFPSKSRFLNILGVLINTSLLLFAADFAYTPMFKEYSPTFTRVGAVDHSSAKIVVRYPDLETAHLRVVYQRVHPTISHTDIWKEGPVLDIEEDKDFTASGKISGLWPSAEYVYRLAYLNSTFLPYPETPILFKTFPDPKSSAGTHFKFVFSSCMHPNFPYNPAFPERIKGLDVLSDWIASLNPKHEVPKKPATTVPADPLEEAESIISDASTAVASATETPITEIPLVQSFLTESKPRELTPEFLIMGGDAIYADVPHWGGDKLEYYRKLYRRTFASSSFRKVYEKLPIFGIYDDHEIVNNFAGEGNDTKVPFFNATNAYDTYYGSANPDPSESDVNYYDFRYGDNAFFVLDTRRYRSVLSDDSEVTELPTMLGHKQLHALHSWFGKVNSTSTFKFIVTSVPFTSLWHGYDGQKDSWAGYKMERDSLLDVMQYIPNIVILSGDRHEFAFIEHRGKIPEVSVGPLSMFAVKSMTLKDQTVATIEKIYIDTITTPDSEVVDDKSRVGLSVSETIPEERAIRYIPDGNYKFVSFEIDTRDWRRPVMILDAIINGKSAYKFEFAGQPVALSYTSSLALSFGGVWKGVMNKLGVMRSVV